MKKTLFCFILLIIPLTILQAGNETGTTNSKDNELLQSLPIERDILSYLGLDLKAIFIILGVPQEIFSYRGDKEEYDDVVFYYDNHLYLFWFQNRVWVIRVDERFTESFLGIHMGMPKKEVINIINRPYKELEDSLIFFLKDQGYPVRLRLFFENESLTDAYLFRGDF